MHDGVEESWEQAMELIRVEKWNEAIGLLKHLVECGVPRAATFLGHHFVGIDLRLAEYWLGRGIELRDPEAYYQLGHLREVQKRDVEAFRHYSIAATHGLVPAEAAMGRLALYSSDLSNEDRALGLRMLQKAAERGHAFALAYCAVAWKRGDFGKRSLWRSFWCRIRALYLGAKNAWNEDEEYLR
jgi:TPR repeat protein